MRCAQSLWGVVCDCRERRGVLFVSGDVVTRCREVDCLCGAVYGKRSDVMSENDVLLTIVRIRFFVKKPLFLGVLRGFVTSKVLSFVVTGELLI